MTDMTITKTAAELRVGDTYTVGVTPLNIKTGASDAVREDCVTVVAVGLPYTDRYGDRWVPVTVADLYGTHKMDKPADSLHTVLA